MTSPTKTRPDRHGAFTLIELLLVLAVAVLLAALAAPAFEGALERARLDAAAERLATAWGDARLEAIRTGEPIAFRCELGADRYRVCPLAGLLDPSAAPTPELGESGASEKLDSVLFRQLSLGSPSDDPPADPAVAAVLVFQPDGSTTSAYAILETSRGARRRVRLRGLTGGARIESISAAAEGMGAAR